MPRDATFARELLDAAIRAADPDVAVRRHLRREGPLLWLGDEPIDVARRQVWVVGAGKAACAMAGAAIDVLGDAVAGGLVVTKRGYGRRLPIRVVEAGHPVPDEEGLRAARDMRDLVAQIDPRDLLVCVWSGGGSALLPLPRAGVALSDVQRTTEALLASGARIDEINAVRRHLSALGGGRLARLASPAPVIALVLSDVVGDDLAAIASGPTSADPSTWEDVAAVVARYDLRTSLPERVVETIDRGLRHEVEETPKPGDPALATVRQRVVGNNRVAVMAAAKAAADAGWPVRVVAEPLVGEARDVGRAIAGWAADEAGPLCIVAGGETTVTLRGHGRGGRCQELALAAALAMDGGRPMTVLAAGTDGTDGPTDVAGAVVDEGTVARMRAAGVDPQAALAANDAYTALSTIDCLVVTGPTGTNVNDVIVVLVPSGSKA